MNGIPRLSANAYVALALTDYRRVCTCLCLLGSDFAVRQITLVTNKHLLDFDVALSIAINV